ncbi:MAG: alanine racemase [Armatimonadota bacterium]|nr:alanine racemase [Armatimonadota bacterium]
MRPAYLEIDLDAIRGNVRAIQQLVGPRRGIAAVVKANAYGHGAVEVARAAIEAGAALLCVALVDEGIELRDAGITAPILVLGPPDPMEAPLYREHDLVATLSSPAHACMMAEAARDADSVAGVHVKLDTGMGRHGARPDVAERLARKLMEMPEVHVEGVFSHFADSTNPDLSWSREQLRRFREMLPLLDDLGDGPLLRHMANSAATVRMPQAHLDAVRPGSILYGINPGYPPELVPDGVRPALSLRCRIGVVKLVEVGEPVGYGCTWRAPRDSRIAVLPVGYADGYARALSGNADVLIGGRRCPVVGRVSMDAITVDVTNAEAATGDEAVLIGRQGEERITVEELAQRASSIVEEVCSRLSARLPRRYIGRAEGGP